MELKLEWSITNVFIGLSIVMFLLVQAFLPIEAFLLPTDFYQYPDSAFRLFVYYLFNNGLVALVINMSIILLGGLLVERFFSSIKVLIFFILAPAILGAFVWAFVYSLFNESGFPGYLGGSVYVAWA